MVGDDKWEGVDRKARMETLETRISQSPSGEDWLDRVRRIGRPDFKKPEGQQGESSDADDQQSVEG